jgi:hypothetical protein
MTTSPADNFLSTIKNHFNLCALTGDGYLFDGQVVFNFQTAGVAENNRICLSTFYSKKQNRGHGARALGVLTEIANQHACIIDTYASADTLKNQRRLVMFYQKGGFVLRSGCLMTKLPNQGKIINSPLSLFISGL